jgi:hypothetical protein
MVPRSCRLECSERFYGKLLFFYPVRFRLRFGSEMVQVFRDYLREEAAHGDPGRLLAFWLRTFKDLAFSIVRERRREFLRVSEIDVVEWADSLVMPMVISVTLLGWGTIGAAFSGVAKLAKHKYPSWNPESIVIASAVLFALGALAILSALARARTGKTVVRPIKL